MAGFALAIREPWWHEHHLVKSRTPTANIHVFGPESPETWKHRTFRDWLRANPSGRDEYAAVKLEAAAISTSRRESVMAYNDRIGARHPRHLRPRIPRRGPLGLIDRA